MEKSKFDMDGLLEELEAFELAGSKVENKEILEFIKKVLDLTLEEIRGGNEKGKDLEEDVKFVLEEIRKGDFLEKLRHNVKKASDESALKSQGENGQDYIFSELCLLIKLARNVVCTLGFLCCRSGKFEVLYDLMVEGNRVLGGYYNWKTRLKSYFMNLITPSMLVEAFSSLFLGKTAVRVAGLRNDNTNAVAQVVSDHFLYVDKAYGDRLTEHPLGEILAVPAILGFPAGKFDLFYNSTSGLFKLPLGFQGWLGQWGDGHIVAFAGTRFSELGTVFTDAEQIFGPSLIYTCAAGLVALVAQHMGNANMLVVGHSLGGGLTQFAVAANNSNNIQGWGFNSAGLSGYSINALISAGGMGNVVLCHYVTGADPVSKFGGLIGEVTTIPGSANLGHSRSDLRQVI